MQGDIIQKAIGSYLLVGPLPPFQILSMPALSPTMTSGTLAKWKKSVGDSVKPGDVLAEVETDKATMEWECQEEGFIAKILNPKGEKDVPIGKPLLVIVEDKTDIDHIPDNIFEQSAPNAQNEPIQEATTQASSKETVTEPLPKGKPGEESSLIKSELNQDKSQEKIEDSDRIQVKISPAAKKLAINNNIDFSKLSIHGSGPGGRIVENDIISMLSQSKKPTTFTSDSFVERPLSNMRRTIARRLTESTTSIPHFYLTCKVNMDSIVSTRERLNNRLSLENPSVKISINDFIVKATAIALKKHPTINASWTGESIREHSSVDISIAVSTGEGLITPIIFGADLLGLSAISAQIKSLAAKAKEGTLTPDKYVGGTFTISNLGMYGITSFTAIINPPQAAILAVGATQKVWKPVQQLLEESDEELITEEETKLFPCHELTLTLSCDHRVIDGAMGAIFLNTLKSIIEDPAQMLL